MDHKNVSTPVSIVSNDPETVSGPKAAALAFEHDAYAMHYVRGPAQTAWNAVGYGLRTTKRPPR